MPPRGLKKLVVESAPGKLIRSKFTGFRAVDRHGTPTGPMLRGITKLLASKLHSKGELDESSVRSTEFRGGAWQGDNGGLRRGKAVDSQVSRLATAGQGKRDSSSKYNLTKLAFAALTAAGLEPIQGQRVVIDKHNGIGTACDIVCYRARDNALVVVELKTGYAGNRTLPATKKNSKAPCKMASPCSTASDCVLYRHMAQLAVTRYLLASETALVKTLKSKFGIQEINGVLLYACDRDTAVYDLESWWVRRSKRIVETIAAPS